MATDKPKNQGKNNPNPLVAPRPIQTKEPMVPVRMEMAEGILTYLLSRPCGEVLAAVSELSVAIQSCKKS